jgi:hypothetical protein
MADTGAVSDLVFLGLLHVFGASTFILFGAISAAGGVYVYRNVPETKGKNLQEVQALMKALHPDAGTVHCQWILLSEISTSCQFVTICSGLMHHFTCIADQDVQQGAPPSFHLAMLAHQDVERSIP